MQGRLTAPDHDRRTRNESPEGLKIGALLVRYDRHRPTPINRPRKQTRLIWAGSQWSLRLALWFKAQAIKLPGQGGPRRAALRQSRGITFPQQSNSGRWRVEVYAR